MLVVVLLVTLGRRVCGNNVLWIDMYDYWYTYSLIVTLAQVLVLFGLGQCRTLGLSMMSESTLEYE